MADLFPMIAAERRKTADFLETLSEEQCATASLCDGWQVRHVAAHLVMPLMTSTPKMILGVVKERGDFNRYSDKFAKATAQRTAVPALASTLKAQAEHRFTPPGVGAHGPLTDIVVHTRDMSVPLGLPGTDPAPEALNEILDFLMTSKATRGFIPKDRVPGLSFASTDTGWSQGSGPRVEGPAAALMLALSGRARGLDDLTGEGVDELRRRVSA